LDSPGFARKISEFEGGECLGGLLPASLVGLRGIGGSAGLTPSRPRDLTATEFRPQGVSLIAQIVLQLAALIGWRLRPGAQGELIVAKSILLLAFDSGET
jgi:hypothetical protein